MFVFSTGCAIIAYKKGKKQNYAKKKCIHKAGNIPQAFVPADIHNAHYDVSAAAVTAASPLWRACLHRLIESAAHIKGPDTAQNAEAGEVPEQGAGAGQNPEENAAQSSEAGVVPGSVSAQNPGISGNTQETSVESTGSGAADPDRNNWKFVLSFAGDINFDENWYTMQYYNTTANGIYDCISPELIQMMRDADIMCINNEFTYSTRGTPLKNKVYTFRAHPSRVNILKELGVDIVSLANNHVYDYGEESLTDTMATLREAGIEYVGAGHDLAEAMEPVYFEIQGRTIAYVAASRAEKYRMTPQATENSPGILRCYDTELFIRKIKRQGKMPTMSLHMSTGARNSLMSWKMCSLSQAGNTWMQVLI